MHVTVDSSHVQPRGQLYEEVEPVAVLSRTSSTAAASRDGRILSVVSEGDDLQIGAAVAVVTATTTLPQVIERAPEANRPAPAFRRGKNLI